MSLAKITIKRPVATVMILLIVVVLGMYSMLTIPMDLMPEIELPIAMVMTTYGASAPEEVESMVTEPLEGALASVEGLKTLMSYSMEGASIVMVQFDYDTDMNMATLDMREKISLVSSYLPDDVGDPMVLKMDMNMLPSMQIYAKSDDMTLAELNATLKDNIIPKIERAGGVASVDVLGGVAEEVLIQFGQQELNMYGLTLSTVSQLLAAENINLPNGNISKGGTDVIVRTMGEFGSVEEIRTLPLMIGDGTLVRLGDIATVKQQYADQAGTTHVDGDTAIGVMVSKQSDANTVRLSKNVQKALKSIEAEYPNIEFVTGYDAADYIVSSIQSVAQSALAGALLAIIVVFLFLRNIRTTLIIAISIPTSLLAAFAVMKMLGMTLNMFTLCALTICVGMLVDNSIVALENIFRLRQEIPDSDEAAEKGANEIFLAILASTLTTILVFIPIAVIKGLTSVIFADFCWTIVIALVSSLVVAVAVVPMLSSKIMRGSVPTEYVRIGERRYKYKLLPKFGAFIEDLTEGYDRLARKALRNRKKVIFGCFAAFGLSLLLILTVGFELLPEADEGEINVSVKMPYGSSLEDTENVMGRLENYILQIPEIEHVAMSTEALSNMTTNSNASLTVVLYDRNERTRSSAEVAEEIQKFADTITEADISASSSESLSSMFGSADATYLIQGKDIDTLKEIGFGMIEEISKLDCVKDAKLDVADGNPEVRVRIDRNAASYYGVSAYQLSSGISNALGGTKATRVTLNGTEIDVRIALEDSLASSPEDMKQIVIQGAYGSSVPVGQIATLEYDNAPTYIYRENQRNTVQLNVNVIGTGATTGVPEVTEIIESYPLPDGYFLGQDGVYDTMIDAFGSLFKALLIAVALVFLLLAAQFESTLMSFVVMMAVPFAMTGAFVMLFLTGTALSLVSFLGLIMLVGTVVNTSILLVEFIRQYQDRLGITEALIMAGRLRLRPILMSTITTIVGMIPLSLGMGDGGEILAPMAISMIGGLIASTIVTLFLVPVVYSIVDDNKRRRQQRRDEKDAHSLELERRWAEEDAAEAARAR